MPWTTTKTSAIYDGPYEGTLKKKLLQFKGKDVDIQFCFVEYLDYIGGKLKATIQNESYEITLGDFIEDEKLKIGECYPFQGEYTTLSFKQFYYPKTLY